MRRNIADRSKRKNAKNMREKLRGLVGRTIRLKNKGSSIKIGKLICLDSRSEEGSRRLSGYYIGNMHVPLSDVTVPPQTTAFKLWCHREHPKFLNKPHILVRGKTQGICDVRGENNNGI